MTGDDRPPEVPDEFIPDGSPRLEGETITVEATRDEWETLTQFVSNELFLTEEAHDEDTVDTLDTVKGRIWEAMREDTGGDSA